MKLPENAEQPLIFGQVFNNHYQQDGESYVEKIPGQNSCLYGIDFNNNGL
jgi:hypothetical protein